MVFEFQTVTENQNLFVVGVGGVVVVAAVIIITTNNNGCNYMNPFARFYRTMVNSLKQQVLYINYDYLFDE